MSRSPFDSEISLCDCHHPETGLFKTRKKIISIHPDVIFLSETQFPIMLGAHSGILVGRGGRIGLRDGQNGSPSRAEDTGEFEECGGVIGHMFQHITDDDSIERGIGNRRHVADIQKDVAVASPEVCGDIFPCRKADPIAELPFGCKMKHVLSPQEFTFRNSRQGGQPVQSRRQQPVPHLACAAWTDRSAVPAVVGQCGALPAADIAFNPVPRKTAQEFAPGLPGLPPVPAASECAPDRKWNQVFHSRQEGGKVGMDRRKFAAVGARRPLKSIGRSI